MNIYCKKQPVGEWLRIPSDWKVKNLHCAEGLVPIEQIPDFGPAKMPYFVTVGVMGKPLYDLSGKPLYDLSLQDVCEELFEGIDEQANFWLLYYYNSYTVCILAAEENYFEDEEYEIITIQRN